MGPTKCKVCDEAQSKYKCPACLIPYCSLVCFKKHKEVPCIKPESSHVENLVAEVPCVKPESPCIEKLAAGTNPQQVERLIYVEEPSEVLQQLQFETIASSSEIRDALRNEELQKLICNIDCSQDALSELDKAMEDEAFRIFTDKIISTLNPQQ